MVQVFTHLVQIRVPHRLPPRLNLRSRPRRSVWVPSDPTNRSTWISDLDLRYTVEKDRKKAEKAAKFLEKKSKQAAQAAVPAAGKGKEKKAKAPKAEEEPLPEYVEDTPVGEKKRLKSFEDPNFKAYNPIAVESAWYSWWEKSGFFQPQFAEDGNVKEEGKFVIVIPPPNVTGALHMGHSLGNSLQDVLIVNRYSISPISD